MQKGSLMFYTPFRLSVQNTRPPRDSSSSTKPKL